MAARALVALLVAGVLVCGPARPALGGSAESPPRPRIGLALGGGGGRGLAHLGALRWLEEHRVPVDLVAGTSMGGLVGGAYATGLDADSLARFIQGLDWPEVLAVAPPYRRLIVRRKQDLRRIPGGVNLSFHSGLTTASGVSAGHEVGLLLSRLALDHSAAASFDDLPIPFRCVAVDLLTGSEIVLDRAPLNRALRATMAIPAMFTAVPLDTLLLVDGGIANNVPADVVRAMGADVVVAVDVGEIPDPGAEIRSVTAAMSRAQMITSRLMTDPRLAQADIVVQPDLEGYTLLSFADGDSLAARGYAAMGAVAERLAPYRLGEAEWREHLAARRARRRHDGAGRLGAVTLRGAAPRDSVRAVLEIQRKAGRGPLRPVELEQALTDLYGWGKYEAFDYRRPPGGEGLVVETYPLAHGPPYLRLGLEIDNADPERADVSLRSRLTFLDLTGFGSELRADLDLGTRSRLAGEWYQPVAGPFFGSLRLFGERRRAAVYQGEERIAEYRLSTAGGEAALGFGVVRRTVEIRAGYRLSDDRNTVRTGDPDLPEPRGMQEQLFLEGTADTQDDPVVPYRGVRAVARGARFLRAPGSDGPFTRTEGRLDAAVPLGARQSLVLAATGGTAFAERAPLFYGFSLGGPGRLAAYDLEELRGSRVVYGSLGGVRRLSEGLIPLHVRLVAEAGAAWDPGGTAVVRACGTLMLVAATPLGPATAGAAAGGGRSRVYVSLGGAF